MVGMSIIKREHLLIDISHHLRPYLDIRVDAALDELDNIGVLDFLISDFFLPDVR